MTEYDTEGAADFLFDEVQEEVCATIRDYLDGLSTLWVDTNQLADFVLDEGSGE